MCEEMEEKVQRSQVLQETEEEIIVNISTSKEMQTEIEIVSENGEPSWRGKEESDRKEEDESRLVR